MELIRGFHRFLTLILTPFALVSCVAVMTTPVTLSLWFIWLLVSLVQPTVRISWYRYTLLIAMQFLCGAILGLSAAIDPNQSPGDAGLAAGAFFFCLFLSVVMARIWALNPTTSERERRGFNMIAAGLFIVGSLAIGLRFVVR